MLQEVTQYPPPSIVSKWRGLRGVVEALPRRAMSAELGKPRSRDGRRGDLGVAGDLGVMGDGTSLLGDMDLGLRCHITL